jgi:Na+/H+ antiporter NhaA
MQCNVEVNSLPGADVCAVLCAVLLAVLFSTRFIPHVLLVTAVSLSVVVRVLREEARATRMYVLVVVSRGWCYSTMHGTLAGAFFPPVGMHKKHQGRSAACCRPRLVGVDAAEHLVRGCFFCPSRCI